MTREAERAYQREYMRWWRKQHKNDPEYKARVSASNKKHRKKRVESGKAAEYSRKWYAEDPARHARYQAKWNEKNADRRRQTNREQKRKRYQEDPQFRLKARLRSRIYYLTRGKRRSKHSLDLIGCSLEELMQHLESQFKEGMGWDNIGKWHVDHIVPCASFDLTDESEQLKCFHYSNLQPLWAVDNLKKGSKVLA